VEEPTIVAVLGPSIFDYLVTMLVITELGYTVLFLSTCIFKASIESLLATKSATYLLADSRYIKLAVEARGHLRRHDLAMLAGKGRFKHAGWQLRHE
jgi:hypothetical protein